MLHPPVKENSTFLSAPPECLLIRHGKDNASLKTVEDNSPANKHVIFNMQRKGKKRRTVSKPTQDEAEDIAASLISQNNLL